MQPGPQHIIQKQVVEVIVNGTVNGFDFQKEMEQFCKHSMLPYLEKLFDEQVTGKQVIRIDRLFVDITASSTQNIEENILSSIGKQLQEKLSSYPEGQHHSSISVTREGMEVLIFYLRKGYLPWWSTIKNKPDWQQFLEGLIVPATAQNEWHVLRAAFQEQVVRDRLIATFGEQQFWQLLGCLSPENETVKADLKIMKKVIDRRQYPKFEKAYKHAVLRSNSVETGKTVYQSIADQLAEWFLEFPELTGTSLPGIRNTELRQLMEIPLTNSAIPVSELTVEEKAPSYNREKAEQQELSSLKTVVPDQVESTDDIYISNSGLVIIAPYLPLFFKRLRLVEKDRLTETSKAVSLLHYIVYGSQDYAEFECVLSKILCGLELNAVVEKYTLNDAEKSQADDLLNAVIENWKVLKNTSSSGLRRSFLQRDGRLSFSDNEWKLTIQRESYDMLLAHLPWNIGMIRLPWMTHLLKTDWL